MKHSNIILPLLAAVALSSCNKQAATDALLPEDRIIRVETSVGPDTKGSYTSDNLDEFVLFVYNWTADEDRYNYKVVFKKVDGDWTPQGGVLPLWRYAEDIIHMTAIAPPSVLGDNVTSDDFVYGSDDVIASVQSDQTKEDTGSDIIGWSKCGEAWRFLENGKVKIDFSHLMSKLTLSFELATEFNAQGIPANDIVSNVIISGAYNKASLFSDMYTDVSAKPYASDSDIKAYNTSWKSASSKDEKCISEWECILVPTKTPTTDAPIDITITFDVNGVAYSCNVTHGFEAECNHKLKIIVGSDVAYPSGMSISAWTNGGSSDLETE